MLRLPRRSVASFVGKILILILIRGSHTKFVRNCTAKKAASQSISLRASQHELNVVDVVDRDDEDGDHQVVATFTSGGDPIQNAKEDTVDAEESDKML